MSKMRFGNLYDVELRLGERYILLAILILAWLVFFGRNLLGIQYTGWDTHDLGFTFFVYFGDALDSGQIPFWNPLIQGGTFHAGLFNAGNYSPFQWIFLLLEQFINPVYAYELMIQAVILVGIAGFYLWLRSTNANRLISIFGAFAFFLSVLVPLVGQIMFLFSLSALPWMLLVCRKAIVENGKNEWASYLLWAVLIASFMASGYPWMNVMNFVIAFLYGCSLYFPERFGTRKTERVSATPANLAVFLIGATVVMACYYAPGYYALKFYYHMFAGDYVSPEPRLRSLAPQGWSFSYLGISDAFFASIDPRVLRNNAANLPVWTWGVGWVVFLTLFYGKLGSEFLRKNFLWFGLLVFWLLYSAGALARLLPHLPLLNANRWWVIGLVYVFISLIVLAAGALQQGMASDEKMGRRGLIAVTIISLAALKFLSAPIHQYVFVLAVAALLHFFVASPASTQRQRGIVWLMALNLWAFISMPHLMPGASRAQQTVSQDPAQDYYHRIEQRVRTSIALENYRRLGKAKEYLFNDEEWLIKKIPFSHGYNPLGNPLYWFLKDEPTMQRLVYATQSVRPERKISREEFSTDEDFVGALIKDVQADAQVPTVDEVQGPELKRDPEFRWEIVNFRLESNQATMRVRLSNAGYVIFNNTYFPGWEVFVDGKPARMISVNRIFQGVYVNAPGEFDVVFKFSPVILQVILFLPLLILTLAWALALRERRLTRREKVQG